MLVLNSSENEIQESLKQVESLVVFENGIQTELKNSQPKFADILEKISQIFASSRIMPAFAVSLHDLTVQDMKTDSWIKLNFSTGQTINELPFDSLLFRLDDCFGFNIIRETDGKFQGRCIYLDLDEKTDLRKILD